MNYCSINIAEHAKRGADSLEDLSEDFEDTSRRPFADMAEARAKEEAEDSSTQTTKLRSICQEKAKDLEAGPQARAMDVEQILVAKMETL